MATYQSVSSTNFPTSESGSVVITKPSGLAVGDVMVAVIAKNDIINENLSSINTPAGWTSQGVLTDSPADGMQMRILTKTADSGDVAASNFTFTASGDCFIGGAIIRTSDFGAFDSVEFDVSGGTTTISYTTTSTPDFANSLIITAFFDRGGGAQSASTYVTTPSITMTERVDMSQSGASESPHLAIATGNYSGTSQITAYGCTFSASATTNAGALIILTPVINVTADISHIAITPTIEGITASQVNVATDIGHTAVTPAINGIETDNSSDRTQWTNPDKPSTTWNNTAK